MMLTKNYIGIILVFVCVGCTNPTDSKRQIDFSGKNIEIEKFAIDSCISTNLFNSINEYIKEVDGYFPYKEYVFYSIYFFSREESNYFTIWAFTCFPDYIENYSGNGKFIYYYFSIDDRKIVLITKEGSKENILFLPCNKNIEQAIDLKSIRPEYEINYDGSTFPKTYEYFKKGDIITLEMQKDPIIDFLGPSYQRFEKNLKN